MDEIEKLLADERPGAQAAPPPTPSKPSLVLTDEQALGVEKIIAWADKPKETHAHFHLGGYAGTGKTTVAKTFVAELRKKYNCQVVAFTGKAVNVLQRKGIAACTAHSLMFDVVEDPDTGATSFVRKPFLPGDIDIIVWDEASMISTELFNTLLSYNKKVIFIGDPGQLEPVGDNPNLMKHNDYTLTKILRQAETSPILSLATSVRLGGPLKAVVEDPEALVIKSKAISSPELLDADQCIVAKNQTRHKFNEALRKYKGYKDTLVQGEKLICLRNNSNLGVFNGMLLWVDRIVNDWRDKWIVNCHDEDGRKLSRLPIWKDPFLIPDFDKQKDIRVPKTVVYCGYGYVVTCHKSQGSEWDHVWVYDEWMPPHIWDMKRWRYTAITRAAQKLTYCV